MSLQNIKSDLHTHTVYSHGKGTPEENVLAAINIGLRRIAISEHAGAHVFYGVRGEKLRALRKELDRLAARYARDIEVLMGYECNLTAFGECDAPDDRSMFDLLLLGYHKGVLPRDGFSMRSALESFHLMKSDPARASESLLLAADKYKINILSHPGEYIKCDVASLARGAKELGTVLEVNSSHVSLSADEVRLASSLGASLCVNSDAHTPSRVGDFAKAYAVADEAGVVLEEVALK